MRAVRIFLIGLGGLCLAVLLRLWLKWAVLSAATLPLLLILVRQFYLPNSKRSVQLWMNPDLLEFTDELSLRLSGREVSLGFFKRWYEFEIEVCDHWLLSLVALASLGATAVVWITDDLPMPNTFWGCSGMVPRLLSCLALDVGTTGDEQVRIRAGNLSHRGKRRAATHTNYLPVH